MSISTTTPSNSNRDPYVLPADAVWFITGCSSGLGLSLARLVAAHPTHRLVATARGPAAEDRLRTLLPGPASAAAAAAKRLLLLELDVTSPESIETAVDAVLKNPEFGRIDVLGK